MHRTCAQEARFKQTGRERGPGHEETAKPVKEFSSEEGEVTADERGTEESPEESVECLSIGVETMEEGSSSTKATGGEGKANEHDSRRPNSHSRNIFSKHDKTTQKALHSPLPSFFVAPMYREISGSHPYRLAKVGPVIEKTSRFTQKSIQRKRGIGTDDILIVPKNRQWTPEEISKLGRSAGVFLSPLGKSKCRPFERLRTPPRRPPPTADRDVGAEPHRKSVTTSPPALYIEKGKTESGGEINEKLVYVVEEKGKSVTKVETDLFTLNEILAIKKDLLELSEFAKKLKKLKQINKELEDEKTDEGVCQCEPTAQVLKDVNKRIEALEARQEELEKSTKPEGKPHGEVESREGSEVKTLSVGLPKATETAKTNAIMKVPQNGTFQQNKTFPKTELFVSRTEVLSNAEDLVSELMDIKAQLKRLEQKRVPKLSGEDILLEGPLSPPGKKDHPIAVFSSKTYILSPESMGKKKAEAKATGDNLQAEAKATGDNLQAEAKATGDNLQVEEKARIKASHWLRTLPSDGNELRMLLKPEPVVADEAPSEGKGAKLELQCQTCSRPLEMKPSKNQEQQKNRAPEKNLKQDEREECVASKMINSRSYTECFVSPSGKFFAWMKKSRERLLKNFRSKVSERTAPNQGIPTYSTFLLHSEISPGQKTKPKTRSPEPVLARVIRPKNAHESGQGGGKREKTARNESMRILERRSLSRDKMNKEDKNEAVKRQEPRLARYVESTTRSSFSEFLETLDFEATSNSVELWRQQSSDWIPHGYVREEEGTARRRVEAKKEEERARRDREKMIIKRERKTGHDRKEQKEMTMRKMSDERNRKKEHRLNPYLDEKNICHDKKHGTHRWCRSPSEEGLDELRKYQNERRKSVCSTEKPSDDRFSLKAILRSFNWLYSRFGSSSISPEFQEKKEKFPEKPENKRGRSEGWEDNYEDLNGSGSSASEDGRQRNHERISSCDCVRAYLETEMLRRLAALTVLQKSSEETNKAMMSSDSTSSSSLAYARKKQVGHKHRRHHRKKKKHRKKEKKKQKKHKHRENDFLCRKCRHSSEVSDKSGEKGKEPSGSAHPKGSNSGSVGSPQKQNKMSAEHSPVMSFLYHFCKSRQQKTGNTPENGYPEMKDSRTYIIPGVDEGERQKAKQQCCDQCGGKMKLEEFENRLGGSEGVKEEETRRKERVRNRSVSEELIQSSDVASLPDTKRRREVKHRCRHALCEQKRRKKKRKKKGRSDEEQERKDQATDCQFLNYLYNGLDKMTETDDRKDPSETTSQEKIRRKKIKDKLSSILYLWKTLRRYTREKAIYGRNMGQRLREKAEKNISKLDRFSVESLTEDGLWQDSWQGRKRFPKLMRRHSTFERKLREIARARRERRDVRKTGGRG